MFATCKVCQQTIEFKTATSKGLIVTNEKFLKEEILVSCPKCKTDYQASINSFVNEIELLQR